MPTEQQLATTAAAEQVLDRGETAVAHPNIALIKYCGKRDEQLMIPYVTSLSMTLDIFPTTTRVRLAPEAEGGGRSAGGDAEE